MPFTPFHLGPGCLTKSILGRHFSLTVFGFAQIAMDLEPLIHLLRGDRARHGLIHTYLGAIVIGGVVFLIGRPLVLWILRRWPKEPADSFLGWLRGPREISRLAVASGAFLGTFSHVLFDSIMHAEMKPLWPVADENELLDLIGMEALHLAGLVLGFVGVCVLMGKYVFFSLYYADAN